MTSVGCPWVSIWIHQPDWVRLKGRYRVDEGDGVMRAQTGSERESMCIGREKEMLRWELNGGFEALECVGSRAESVIGIDVKV